MTKTIISCAVTGAVHTPACRRTCPARPPENVFLMKQTADRLFGKDYVWSLPDRLDHISPGWRRLVLRTMSS